MCITFLDALGFRYMIYVTSTHLSIVGQTKESLQQCPELAEDLDSITDSQHLLVVITAVAVVRKPLRRLPLQLGMKF